MSLRLRHLCGTAPHTVFVLVAILLMAASYVPTAWAQTTNASISGTITDNTGAVLPGVAITVTSPALQVPQLVRVSENDGTYQVSTLPIGIYRVSYELSGFTTLVREDIRLTNAFAARVDVVLPVASLALSIHYTSPV